jgi:hypothetical protein
VATRSTIGFALLALLAVPALGAGHGMKPPRRSTELPRPRDPDAAVREELDAARREHTVAAYDRFIARHDGHPLVAIARRERRRLAR